MKMKKNSPVYSRFYIYTCVCVRNELRTPTNIFVNEYIRTGVLRKNCNKNSKRIYDVIVKIMLTYEANLSLLRSKTEIY